MNIILIGPPASGKGTQSALLEKEFDLVHVSTGDLLRNIARQHSKLADEINSCISMGKFIPDGLITELLKSHLSKIGKRNGILLDGYPRTVQQAKSLKDFLQIDFVIELKLSTESVVGRVLDRAVCPVCGKSYFKSKTPSGECDKCHAKLVVRSDDTEQIAKKRVEDFYNQTYPVIDYYKNSKCYHQIDGEKSPNEVFDQICKVIRSV